MPRGDCHGVAEQGPPGSGGDPEVLLLPFSSHGSPILVHQEDDKYRIDTSALEPSRTIHEIPSR